MMYIFFLKGQAAYLQVVTATISLWAVNGP